MTNDHINIDSSKDTKLFKATVQYIHNPLRAVFTISQLSPPTYTVDTSCGGANKSQQTHCLLLLTVERESELINTRESEKDKDQGNCSNMVCWKGP